MGSTRLLCLAAAFLAGSGCGFGEDPSTLEARDARIASLEEQVGKLESDLASAGPLGEPPEAAWVVIGAEQWATNGHVLVRRDGPRPYAAAVRQAWQIGMTAEHFAGLVHAPAPYVSLTRVDVFDEGGTALERYRREPDGAYVYIDGAYAVLLSTGRTVQGEEALGPVYALADDGSAMAVVMPRTAPGGAPAGVAP